MNILFPLSSNGVRPINNSLKNICLAAASSKKRKSCTKIIGLVDEIFQDASYELLTSLGIKIVAPDSKGLLSRLIFVRCSIKMEEIDTIHCAGFKQLIFFFISTLFMFKAPSIIMTDRTTNRWNSKFSRALSKLILGLIRPHLHVLNRSHYEFLKGKSWLFKALIFIPNSIDTSKFYTSQKKLQNGRINVCYIKSIREDTGHEDIIKLGRLIKSKKKVTY